MPSHTPQHLHSIGRHRLQVPGAARGWCPWRRARPRGCSRDAGEVPGIRRMGDTGSPAGPQEPGGAGSRSSREQEQQGWVLLAPGARK